MKSNQNKIKLSPRLSMGVGRGGSRYSFFKIGTTVLIILSVLLTARAGYLLFKPNSDATTPDPQVLGAEDDTQAGNEQLYNTYSVKSGDTLFTISQEYGVQWTAIATLNNLEPPFALKVGQELKIPKK